MKRQNGVILDGVLAQVRNAGALGTLADEVGGPGSLLATLVTDASRGSVGQHVVLLPARLASEVRAFARASSGNALEVTVWGYLLGTTAVAADRVTFHVPNAVRAAAAAELRKNLQAQPQRRSPCPPEPRN